MVRTLFIIVPIVLSLSAAIALAEPVIDTTRNADTTALASTDSLLIDSASLPDSLLSDTLTAAQKAQLRFEQRFQQRQEELAEERRPNRFSYTDSLFKYFTSTRLNLRSFLDQANQHDAGDYFRSEPAYFVTDWQESPMRKTVQPYGLLGDRLDVVQGGMARHPFEHVPEPNGLIDLNDIPTGMDGDVFIMPGATGLLFGGEQAVATLVTRPPTIDDDDAHSTFLVDKGAYGYSNARARFSRSFTDGRHIDFSLGYRNADGPGFFGNDDDAYHYTADFIVPVRERLSIHAAGMLYDREGSLRVDGVRIDRDRFDRSARIGFERASLEGTAMTGVYYRHERSSDNLARNYFAKLNHTSNGLTISRDWLAAGWFVHAAVDADHFVFDYGRDRETRTELKGKLSAASHGDGLRYGFAFGTGWSKEYKMTPFGSATAYYESDVWLLMISAGYAERAPSQKELYLPQRTGNIYALGLPTYADQGNPTLSSEKQATGSVTIEAGGKGARCRLEVTGGRIFDGIDWINSFESVNGSAVRLFEPVNGDVDFLTAALLPQLRITDFLRLKSGASYHYTAYETMARPAYSPEYQFFAGGEVHIFWPQRLLHFYAYGELAYTGPYEGLDREELGGDPVANAKLSVQMGRFRFHFAFNNVFSRVYAQREESYFVGRYTSYGFIWDFLN